MKQRVVIAQETPEWVVFGWEQAYFELYIAPVREIQRFRQIDNIAPNDTTYGHLFTHHLSRSEELCPPISV
jgi:hypothetical protein